MSGAANCSAESNNDNDESTGVDHHSGAEGSEQNPPPALVGATIELLPSNAGAPPFYYQKHVDYIVQLSIDLAKETSYEGAVTEHLKMSGVYWSLTALHILLPAQRSNDLLHVPDAILDWLWSCYDRKSHSFGGNTGHEGHLLYTLSALQILALSDELHSSERLVANRENIAQFVASLQQPDGSFVGDTVALEIDTRFTYCALQSLALLDALDRVDLQAAADYILLCRNIDGGFGSCPGAESHAGQVFCCVAALAICRQLPRIDTGLLGWWLSERQVDSGGLNGRPEKQADVCYSWWILSALSITGQVNYINVDKLAAYILNCQDDEDGGIADRPDDMADVFHTFFGIAGLDLLGFLKYRQIDPIYALPTDVVQKLQLPGQVLVRPGKSVDARLKQYHVVSSD
jgi:geranylgeranyl transferase type-2 subunit beta